MTRTGEQSIASGELLLGKYQVEEVIGRGGMGLVVRARHIGLDEQVAIKLLRDDVAIDEETIARFLREAQAAVKLKSEHVARITDVGKFDDGKPYMVMEYLQGADIGQMVDQHGGLHPSLAVDLLIQACDALAEAHSIGIIHRDVKPSNLFVTVRPDGSSILKVLDFGISKSIANDMSLTQTQSMLGTPAYMSPEQMRSARKVDARTDIWSLGSVLYEAIEGELPFKAESFSEMCVMVAVDPPTPMTKVPIELQPIILKCLAKHPDGRYPSVAELAAELVQYHPQPHRAKMLVDRMYRTLRRSTSVADSSSGTAIPAYKETATSMSMPMAAASSAPALAIPHPTLDPRTGTGPIMAPAKRSKRWLAFAIPLGFAALVGLAVIAGNATKPAEGGGSNDALGSAEATEGTAGTTGGVGSNGTGTNGGAGSNGATGGIGSNDATAGNGGIGNTNGTTGAGSNGTNGTVGTNGAVGSNGTTGGTGGTNGGAGTNSTVGTNGAVGSNGANDAVGSNGTTAGIGGTGKPNGASGTGTGGTNAGSNGKAGSAAIAATGSNATGGTNAGSGKGMGTGMGTTKIGTTAGTTGTTGTTGTVKHPGTGSGSAAKAGSGSAVVVTPPSTGSAGTKPACDPFTSRTACK